MLLKQPTDVVALAGVLPVDGSELEQSVLGPGGQQTEDVAQVRPGLDVAETGAREQRGEGRVDSAGVVATDEEPVLSTDGLAA
jgi:hypothetical protein